MAEKWRRNLIQLVPLALLACSDPLSIKVEQTGSGEVEGAGAIGGLLGAFNLGGFDDLDVSIDQQLANQGVAKGDVSSVRLDQLTLSTPDGDDLSFISSIDVFIESPGVDKTRIAHLDDFPEGQKSVDLELDDVDLVDYVVADSLTISTEASGSAPENDTEIDAYIALDVEATAQGACNAAQQQSAQ
jgi:hypothetical protein